MNIKVCVAVLYTRVLLDLMVLLASPVLPVSLANLVLTEHQEQLALEERREIQETGDPRVTQDNLVCLVQEVKLVHLELMAATESLEPPEDQVLP